MTLTVVRNCLGYTHAATVQLQGVEVGILKGLRMEKTAITSEAKSEVELKCIIDSGLKMLVK